ncbi:GIY-YIG nuclease superfamily protein [Desulfosporosinus acididurans]|uniref:GIY-YIG nuclease superfamily protein n=1 Tax=Desulfosporosinus acididurans TaxID=476652 RepID=A0A0J1FY64_9FIRM|nr:GIY-YIG nuclease family protein [Desulfosporosinus acididurans]KLU67948.1 GIY-YIG nuclease superfamily protein [Desulfosporosinus acididurans]
MGYWVYLARCGDDTIYTGATTDLERRAREHNGKGSGRQGAKYTASHGPVSLVQAWEVNSWGNALRLEYAIKRCDRAEKLRLTKEPWEICRVAERRQLTFCISVATKELHQVNSFR